MAELLQESGITGEHRKFLLALRDSGLQMRQLIEHCGSRRAGAGIQHFNGLHLMEQVVRAHWPEALKRGIGLYLLFDHRLPECWHSDASGLRQMVDNLLSNAVKFTPQGHVLVHVRQSGNDRNGAAGVEVSVCDTGIGIAHVDRHRIWSIHDQGSGIDARRCGGSGLGLFICREIVASLGGSLRHRPNPVGGTCFTAVLPGIANAGASRGRLHPGLLTGLRCRLALGEPASGVLAEWLRRMGVRVTPGPKDGFDARPGNYDFVITEPGPVDVAGSRISCGMLISRFSSTGRDKHETEVSALPAPLLYSNLQPMILRIALARAMSGRAGSGVK